MTGAEQQLVDGTDGGAAACICATATQPQSLGQVARRCSLPTWVYSGCQHAFGSPFESRYASRT